MRSDCRLCNFPLSSSSLSLTPTPPANEFVSATDLDCTQDEFPLDLYVCQNCGHTQLAIVVDPVRLFSNYVYVSGTSPVFVAHFERYAHEMIEKHGLVAGDLVIDIGSNDGTLLRFFQRQGMRVLGVDPAKAIAQRATASGIHTIPEFFTPALATSIYVSEGPASLVVANNMFAHADGLDDITDSVHKILTPDGHFVFEVSYLVDVCEKTLFDTIYHEHLAYHTLGPLVRFLRAHRMIVTDAERNDIQGGTIRVTSTPNSNAAVHHRVADILHIEQELGFTPSTGHEPLGRLSQKIEALRERLVSRLRELRAEGKKIAAFGAPAKATTLMYHFGLGRDVIDFVVDDNPLKQGLFTPGKHVPVLPSSALEENKPDYLLILAWNFADSIIQRNQVFLDRGGKFIVPVPEYREVG